MSTLPILLAFLIGLLVSSFELMATRFPQTSFLIVRSLYYWVLGIIYGALAALGMVLLAKGVVKLEGLGLGSVWAQAVVMGLSTKALLHIRLWTTRVGGTDIPLGTESIVMIFEPWLLSQLILFEFNTLRTYLASKAADPRYNDLAVVKTLLLANVPPTLTTPEKAAYVNDVNACLTVDEAMELCLRRGGRQTFKRLFP